MPPVGAASLIFRCYTYARLASPAAYQVTGRIPHAKENYRGASLLAPTGTIAYVGVTWQQNFHSYSAPHSSSVSSSARREATSMPAILSATQDAYDGVVIDAEQLPDDHEVFGKTLLDSLETWKEQRLRGVWLQVPIARANLINVAINAGFTFHHAETTYVMLTHWLPATESTLPANASHQVGVGAFVLNENQEVLCVQEAHGPLRGKGVWKMPTGLVNAGEDVPDAAVREVQEETGVRTVFDCMLACRQAHGFGVGHNKSDLFFVAALRPEPGQARLVPQEEELADARWLPLQEFLSLEFLRQRPLHSLILDRCQAYAQGAYQGLRGHKLQGGLRKEPELLLIGDPLGDGVTNGTGDASRL